MPALVPKDLSDAWWEKNKAKTLKSADFSKALRTYNKTRAQSLEGTGARFEAFADYESAYKSLKDARAKTEKACTKGVHDSTREYLKAYQKMIEADHQVVAKTIEDYQKAFDDLDGKAASLARMLEAFKKEAATLFKGFDAIDRAVDTGSGGPGKQDPMEFRLSAAYSTYLDLSKRQEAVDAKLRELAATYRAALSRSAVTDKDLKTSSAIAASDAALSTLTQLLESVRATDERLRASLPR